MVGGLEGIDEGGVGGGGDGEKMERKAWLAGERIYTGWRDGAGYSPRYGERLSIACTSVCNLFADLDSTPPLWQEAFRAFREGPRWSGGHAREELFRSLLFSDPPLFPRKSQSRLRDSISLARARRLIRVRCA